MDDLERIAKKAQDSHDRWASVGVLTQSAENADTLTEATLKWSRIYKLFDAAGESAQDEVFAAVTAYFLVNGCSPAGKYSKPIKTAGGKEVTAGEVVKITGRLEGEIRQFLRGRLKDSYQLLKHNAAMIDDNLVAKAQNKGVPRVYAWLLADWLGENCPYFVGEEVDVYRRLRASNIAVAHEKQVHALPRANRVIESAPETHMGTGPVSGIPQPSGGLY